MQTGLEGTGQQPAAGMNYLGCLQHRVEFIESSAKAKQNFLLTSCIPSKILWNAVSTVFCLRLHCREEALPRVSSKP